MTMRVGPTPKRSCVRESLTLTEAISSRASSPNSASERLAELALDVPADRAEAGQRGGDRDEDEQRDGHDQEDANKPAPAHGE
jgi:hypothetical protein